MHTARDQRKRTLSRPLLFAMFFVSGFCGLVYQVVWTRLAFAAFGIITPVLSVVLSVFMLGLALGAWGGGRWIGTLVSRTGRSAITLYALAELLIGMGAFAVPGLFGAGQRLLLTAGQTNSLSYLFLSALVLALSILPWCVFMGATFPLMMAFVRERAPEDSKSFSYLYSANVLGATAGTLLTALALVEMFGFRHTLWIAAAGNFSVAAVCARLGWGQSRSGELRSAGERTLGQSDARGRLIPLVLFSTGFVSMAMEVVWIRAFTPVVKTQVYSFALVVASYLLATFLGSLLYRRQLHRRARVQTPTLLGLLCIAAFLPVLANDPRLVRANWGSELHPASVAFVLLSIWPFCAILGYLTPSLVDEHAGGAPAGAGRAYALNVLGCILGPLCASYLLLAWVNERFALILLGLPLFALYLVFGRGQHQRQTFGFGLAAAAAAGFALFVSDSYEDYLAHSSKKCEVRRDYAAAVVAFDDGKRKHLLVNGIGMTALTPVTKFMVHLPLAFHRGKAESALIICFGMGTSYRSALSWGVDTTAVELVPSVRDAFGFYHADAAQLLKNPHGRIVIDDGRRFLNRTREQFDVIVIDPPPPVEAAGSSLLYSKEFYEAARRRLKPNGVLQAWYPGGSHATFQAVVRSLRESFPHVRSFQSVGKWGTHLLASVEPLDSGSADELAGRLPPAAAADLLEWSMSPSARAYLGEVLAQEMSVEEILAGGPAVRITDDRPYNEYFLMRELGILRPGR